MPRTRPAELASLDKAIEAVEQPDDTQGPKRIDSNDRHYRKSEGESPQPSLTKREQKNIVPLFSTMSERYEYLCEQERPLTDMEVQFFEEFYRTDAGKRMLRMDGNILQQKETEGMQYPAKVTSLPITKATG